MSGRDSAPGQPAIERGRDSRRLQALLLLAVATVLLSSGTLEASSPDFEQRVACERSLEEVRWRRRLWPEDNPQARPPLSAMLRPGVLEARVEETILKSNALATIWNRPLSEDQLRIEIEHMARDTRAPEMLRELWDALDNDPLKVAECLARPLLADRLVRNWYSLDPRFHESLRRKAEAELQQVDDREQLRLLTGDYSETVWTLEPPGPEPPSFSSEERRFSEHQWEEATARLAETFGLSSNPFSRSTEPGELPVVSPIREDGNRFFVVAVLESQPGRLRVAEVAWRKVPFHDWWAETRSTIPAAPGWSEPDLELPTIGATCSDDSWSPMRHLPNGRAGHVAVWTGSEMLVWGNRDVFGATEPGGRYDPATDVWHTISTRGHPEGNLVSTGIWTGTEMIVWGGIHGDGSPTVVSTGARYDPIADRWTPTSTTGAPSPRGLHAAVWTGTEMIVWGGCGDTGNCGAYLDTGGRYDPASDTWTPTGTTGAPSPRQFHTGNWTGSEMVIWAGEGPGVFNTLNDGARYDPLTDAWTSMTETDAPEARIFHTAVSTGSEILVFGGCRTDGCFEFIAAGARYDLAADSWAPISDANAPSARYRHSAIWTGSEMILHGGCVHDECSAQSRSGGRYDPSTDTWMATSEVGATYHAAHTAIWTGSEMILWGGCSGGECQTELPSGGRYDPATDSWVPTSLETGPVARINHSAVWTGAEMIIWGGAGASNDGARYDPATDHWIEVNPFGGKGRDRPTAIWTGTEMLVWGGSEAGVGASNTGERYDVISDSWTPMSTVGAPQRRLNQTGVWTGTEMIVWGGCAGCSAPFFQTGGRYDPVTDSWSPTSTIGAPTGRISTSSATQPLSVWTGSEMIVWGGWPAGAGETDTGGRYDPTTDTWRATSLAGAPAARRHHTLVWTGSEMIVWGGEDSAGTFGDGARYSPATDGWTDLNDVEAPLPRMRHGAVWTGSEMIVWGGTADGLDFDTGGRYGPVEDSWRPTSTGASTPFPRHLQTTAWTGDQMLLWGGAWNQTGQTGTGAAYCAQASIVGCEDLLRLRARCTVDGRLQARLTLHDMSHDGQSVIFDVDGRLIERPVVNGRASFGLRNQGGSGPRIISLAEPAGCAVRKRVTCN